MELTKESEGLLDKIIPPRLEDAGLEDCALPPESIKEAFLKAATAVRSIISASDDEDEPSKDVLVGITDGINDGAGKCTTEKGMPEGTSDVVAVEGVQDEEDNGDLVDGVPLPEGGESCVDGLKGLEIGDKSGKIKKIQGDSDEDSEKPILVEGFV